jgi:signal transduction histidine kinase
MNQDPLVAVAAWAMLGLVLGAAVVLVLWRLSAMRRADAEDRSRRAARRGDRLHSAAEVFDTALILIDGEEVELVGGAEGLAACAAALGLEGGDVFQVIGAIVRLDPEYRRRLEALVTRGEAFAVRALGPAGAVLVEGRSAGAWAWLRLSPAAEADMSGPDARRLAGLVDAQGDPAWLANAEGAPAWVGRAWLDAVGAPTLQEALARGAVFDRTADALVREAAAAGQVRHSLHWIRTARGRRALQIVATPLSDGGVAAWAKDVTEVEGAREALRRDAATQSQVLTHTGDAIAVFDSLRRLVFHNPAFTRLWDLEPAWLADRPTHGEILDRLRQGRRLPETVDYARFRAVELAGHQQVEPWSEAIWRLPSERTLRVARLPHPGGGLTLIFTDITPELRLKSQFNHLIQVQRATLDKLTDAVAVFDADGRLKLHNEAFERFWGIAAGQLARAPDFDGVVELCVPRVHDRQFWRDLKARITDPDPLARAPTQGEVVTAERRIVAFQSRPLPDGATLIGFSDITDTRRLEEALRDREAALAEADRLKRAFVGSVSYELRTPLTTIIGYAELLERTGAALAERERGYIAAVLAAARHLAGSIDDVLETAEIDAGEAVLEVTDVDVDILLRRAAQRRLDDALRAEVVLKVEAATAVGLISGDGSRLAQVLDHLLANALNQTPAGGAITLSASRGQGEVRLSVADNGRGFPFDVQAHIFDRFSNTGRGGQGLGLALVKALVELHGGWVALESEPGAGATFTCHLPEIAQAPTARPRLF